MKVSEIYSQYHIPPNLRDHMFRVAKVAHYVFEHWKSTPLNKDILLTATLLHDIGSIVKFNLEKNPEFLGKDEVVRKEYWQEIQNDMIARYGNDDHASTSAILKELQISPIIIQMIDTLSFKYIENIVTSDDYHFKILAYADWRVDPFGVSPLVERIDEVLSRRSKYDEEYKNIIRNKVKIIEEQIQNNTNIPLSSITNDSTFISNETLLDYNVLT